MNTRFFLNFLTAPKRNAGFAMPMVIMGGLVITVAAAAIAMKGMNDQNQVTAKAQKASSMAAAETGLVRLQDTLSKNRVALLYDGGEWSSAVDSDGVPDTTNAVGSEFSDYISLVSSGGTSACPVSMNASTIEDEMKDGFGELKSYIDQGSSGTFSPLSGDPNGGEFRVVSYDYGGTSGVRYPQASGRLTIEGKSGNSITRLVVDIPISGGSGALDGTGVPGLWTREGGIDKNWESPTQTSVANNSDNYQFDALVAFSNCGQGNDPTKKLSEDYINDVKNQASGSVVKADFPMPVIPKIPSNITPAVLSSNSLGKNKNNVVELSASSFPAPTDGDGYAVYTVSGDLDGYMSVPNGRKVRIYVSGDIDASIYHDGNPYNVQVFGTGNSGSICMNGNSAANIHAFILAPNYDAGKTGNGQIRGSLFVKSWGKSSCMSSNPTVAMVQTDTWSSVPPSLRPYSPLQIGGPSSWQTISATTTPAPAPTPTTSPVSTTVVTATTMDTTTGGTGDVDDSDLGLVDEVVDGTTDVIDEVICVKGFFTSGSKKGQCKD
jgi:hypothetical protein